MTIEARTDINGQLQHAKLLMNLNNAINALSGLPLRDQLGQRAYRRCLALCQREALAAYRASGITPGAPRPDRTSLYHSVCLGAARLPFPPSGGSFSRY